MKFHAIKENHLYRKAYKSSLRKGTDNLVVYVLRDRAAGLLKKQNPEKKTINRIGISASKKVGGAVQRNRAKRVTREAYRAIDKDFGVKKGHLIVLVVREKCTVSKMQDVKRDLLYALGKLDMLENPPEKTSAE